MDEAERCHKLGYILSGRLLAQGTADDIIASQALVAWNVAGPGLAELAPRLRALPAVDQVAAFGSELHITGTDAGALDAALTPFKAEAGRHWERIEPGLEDVFIHLMQTQRRDEKPAEKTAVPTP
jgi:ABC-2 type transport system ATP-binding protein